MRRIYGTTLLFILLSLFELYYNIILLHSWQLVFLMLSGVSLLISCVLVMPKVEIHLLHKHIMVICLALASLNLIITGSGNSLRFVWLMPLILAIGLLISVNVKSVRKRWHKITLNALSAFVVTPVILFSLPMCILLLLTIAIPDAIVRKPIEALQCNNNHGRVVLYSIDQGALGIDFELCLEKTVANQFILQRRITLLDVPNKLTWEDSTQRHVKVGDVAYPVITFDNKKRMDDNDN